MMGTDPPIARPPAPTLMQLINGYQISQAIYVFATLGIPDLLSVGPLGSSELAARTGSHEGALYRVLRALAAVGILTEDSGRRFALTALGDGLRSDPDCSQKAWVNFAPRAPYWQAWGAMLHCVRTGQTAFQHVHGLDVWAYRTIHQEEHAIFAAAMREKSACLGQQLPSHYDFAGFAHIVDVGGGDGSLLAGLLPSCPAASGTVLDLPHVVAGAPGVFSQAGVNNRCAVIAGSFFDAVPCGGDAYLLKHILHDWDDEHALAILRNCRRAMKRGARLLVIERLIAPPNEGAEGKLSDLNMLVNTGGRERTPEEFTALLEEAGFAIAATLRLPDTQNLIDAVPSRSA